MNLLKKIFPHLCLTISFLLLIYTFFKSEIHWGGSIDYYIPYYVISFLLIIFSVITFFLNQQIKEYLIIILISIFVSMYISESYLTFKKDDLNFQIESYEKKTGKKYDIRTPYEIYKELDKGNNNVVLPVGYFKNKKSEMAFFSGISNSKTIMCNENGYYSIYQSDRYGFNNPDYEWDKDEVEYLLIGDSFAHGACVKSSDNIASVLRTLSNKSVLNLGYGGYGPLIEYAILREYLNPNIKKVFWIYYEGNDLKELQAELEDKILINYLNDLTFSQNLKSKQNQIDFFSKAKIKDETIKQEKGMSFSSKLFNFFKIYNLRLLLLAKYKTVVEVELKTKKNFKQIIELANNLVIKNNSKLYFIYFPTYSRYKTAFNNSDYLLVKKIVNELNIPFIDIHNEVFKKEINPLTFFPYELKGHYNEEGYKKITKTIFKLTK